MTLRLKRKLCLFLLSFAFLFLTAAWYGPASDVRAAEGAAPETTSAAETAGDGSLNAGTTGEAAAVEKTAGNETAAAETAGDGSLNAGTTGETAAVEKTAGNETAAAEAAGDGSLSAEAAVGDGSFSVESAEVITDEYLEALISHIREALPTGNGDWAVYVIDLVRGTESGINDGRMQAASLIKLYIMGAVYEDYENLTAQYGQDSIDSWLYNMITVSDNDSANALVSCLGGGDSSAGMMVVNDYCLAHGYYQTSMGRLLLQSNEFGDNYTSVSDCAHFLMSVYDEDFEEFPHVDSMYSLLKAQTRRNKIPAQMPAEVGVANKTGELDDVENDAAILYDTTNDLVIVFMSEYLSDVGNAQYTIASLSRHIYDYYCG